MKKILTIGGSNSKNSISKILAEYAADLLNNVEVINIDLNDYEIPLFSVDAETDQGFPKGATDLSNIIDTADGFIISLAEHNGAYSSVFKNTFDWLSRINGKVWRVKPLLLLATSPGARGGQSVLEIASARFPFNGGVIVGSMSLPFFSDNFKEGELVHKELKSTLLKLVSDFQKAI